jgi:hypothetical protein
MRSAGFSEAAANLPHLLRAQLQQIPAVEENFAVDGRALMFKQPH